MRVPNADALARPRRRGESAGLTLDAVVDAAIRIMDRDGLEAVSVRSIAGELGVHPTALYNHASSKQELLDAVARRCVDRLPRPRNSRPPADELRRFFRALRTLGIRHPGLLHLVGASTHNTSWPTLEAVQRTLITAGLAPDEALTLFLTLLTLTLGSALVASNLARSGGERAYRREIAAAMSLLPTDKFPTLRALADVVATRADLDRLFDQELALVLAALDRASEGPKG